MTSEKRKALQRLNLEQLLDRQPLRVHPDTAIAAVIDRMNSCALIVLENKLLGIFTERDLVRLVVENADLQTTPISAAMTQPVRVLKHSEARDIFKVLSIMQQHRIRQIPMVEENGLLSGLITQTSILQAIGLCNGVLKTADVTQQRQTDLALKQQYQQGQLIGNVTRRIREPLELEEILKTAVTEVQAILNCDRVLVIERAADSNGQVIEESMRSGIQPALLNQSVSGLALATIPDPGVPQTGVASLEIAIYVESQPWGLLVASQNQSAREWQSFEIELMEHLADQMGVAIAQAQLLGNLETLVEQRTVELSETNDRLQLEIQERTKTESALRESQQQLGGILETAGEAIISIDEQHSVVLFN